MSTQQMLLSEVEAFLAETGMAPATFGRKALGDSKFVLRLRRGGGTTLDSADRVLAFIDAQRLAAA